MSFERRISSLPLYTRNLHIFPTSEHTSASGGISEDQAGYDSQIRGKTVQQLHRTYKARATDYRKMAHS